MKDQVNSINDLMSDISERDENFSARMLSALGAVSCSEVQNLTKKTILDQSTDTLSEIGHVEDDFSTFSARQAVDGHGISSEAETFDDEEVNVVPTFCGEEPHSPRSSIENRGEEFSAREEELVGASLSAKLRR